MLGSIKQHKLPRTTRSVTTKTLTTLNIGQSD